VDILKNKYNDVMRNVWFFMDNLSSHIGKYTRKYFRRKGLNVLFNAPYNPEYQPIEFYFNIIKKKVET
jgi:transposase